MMFRIVYESPLITKCCTCYTSQKRNNSMSIIKEKVSPNHETAMENDKNIFILENIGKNEIGHPRNF